MNSLKVVVSVWIQQGRAAQFEVFEHKAAAIMRRHGGAVIDVVRMKAQPAASTDQPFEVHVLEFPSVDAFESYRTDPALADLATLRSEAIARTEVLLGTAGPKY